MCMHMARMSSAAVLRYELGLTYCNSMVDYGMDMMFELAGVACRLGFLWLGLQDCMDSC